MSAPQIASPVIDLGSLNDLDMQPVRIRQCPIEPPPGEPVDAEVGTIEGAAGAEDEPVLEPDQPEEWATVTPLPTETQTEVPEQQDLSVPARKEAPARPVAPTPPPSPQPPQEPTRREFPGARFYPWIFWISVVVGLAGQILGFGSQFGGLWYSYCGAVVVGGIFELTMITAGDTALTRIGQARPTYEWAPFLLISLAAAGVATYMNFTHWVWAGPTMALYFGGLTVGGYLGHMIEGLFDALQDRRATLRFQRERQEYEQHLADEADEARKEWKRYQRTALQASPSSSASRPSSASKTSRKKSKSSTDSAVLDRIVDYAQQNGLGARAARTQYRENFRPRAMPSEKTVQRALNARKSAS